MLLFVVTPFLGACNFVNHHVVKLTSTPLIVQGTMPIVVKTTKGSVYLSSLNINDKDLDMLKHIEPLECLTLMTLEPFAMNNREVHFESFKLRKLLASDSGCRNIRSPNMFTAPK